MDLVFELFFEIYLELMLLIVPEKNASKKYILTAKIIAIAVLIALIALFIWGVVLIEDYNNIWGVFPISIAVVFSLVQVIAGIILYKKNH